MIDQITNAMATEKTDRERAIECDKRTKGALTTGIVFGSVLTAVSLMLVPYHPLVSAAIVSASALLGAAFYADGAGWFDDELGGRNS